MWPWRKDFWEMPIKNLVFWISVVLVFYFTYLLGVDHGRTNRNLWDMIRNGLSRPLSCVAPPPPSAPAPPSVDFYTILVNRFPTEDAAIQFRTRLASERINSRVMPQNGGYYVVVGKFTSLGQAQNMLQKLRQKGYPRATILSPVK